MLSCRMVSLIGGRLEIVYDVPWKSKFDPHTSPRPEKAFVD